MCSKMLRLSWILWPYRLAWVHWHVDFGCFIVVFTSNYTPSKSKSFHQNRIKCECDTSFRRKTDYISCCELLRGAELWALSRLAGERDYLLVQRSFIREATGSGRQDAWPIWKPAWLEISPVHKASPASIIESWKIYQQSPSWHYDSNDAWFI